VILLGSCFDQIQSLEHTIKLVVKGQYKAESLDEMIDLSFKIGIIQMNLADDLLEVEHKLIKIIECFEGLSETEADAAYFLSLP
jgi:hypothetical protein